MLGLKNENIHPKCVSCSFAYCTWREKHFCAISLLELLYRNDRFPSGLVTRCSKVRLPLGVTQIFPSEPHVSLTQKSFFVYWNFFRASISNCLGKQQILHNLERNNYLQSSKLLVYFSPREVPTDSRRRGQLDMTSSDHEREHYKLTVYWWG